MKEYAALSALIVEPNIGMRGNLHNMLTQCDITKIDHAVSSGTTVRAIEKRKAIESKSFDIILCEYDLGDGQDGQQLLEDLRHNNLITMWTIFIMVTSERAYAKVVSAAELAPTDYILKPFTAEMLLVRIGRALEKRAIFYPVYQLMGQGNLRDAIEACEVGEVNNRRYIVDFMRLRAELHTTLGEAILAEPIYTKILESKAIAWARLGLAKTLYMQDRLDEAATMLSDLVVENEHFMDAHDWLAKTHEAIGNLPEAQKVLQGAVAISPHAVRRLRKLGEVAMQVGDVEVAEKSFQQVVSKAKYSEFRDPEDHVRLVQSLVQKGEANRAATVIRDLEKSLGDSKKTPACRALSSAFLHQSMGNTEKAAEELTAALAACRTTVGISTDMKLALAKSCLENDMEAGASEIMLDVMSNASNSAAIEKAKSVFEQAGRGDLAESTVKASRKQVVDLVSSGAEKAKQGDYQGAVTLMLQAADKLPDNPQVVFNAAVAILKYLENLGWDNNLGARCKLLVETARRLDPANPRLTPLADLYRQIMKKYGMV